MARFMTVLINQYRKHVCMFDCLAIPIKFSKPYSIPVFKFSKPYFWINRTFDKSELTGYNCHIILIVVFLFKWTIFFNTLLYCVDSRLLVT